MECLKIEENGRGCRPKKFTIYEAITWNLLACKNAYSWELKLLVMVMKKKKGNKFCVCNAVADNNYFTMKKELNKKKNQPTNQHWKTKEIIFVQNYNLYFVIIIKMKIYFPFTFISNNFH